VVFWLFAFIILKTFIQPQDGDSMFIPNFGVQQRKAGEGTKYALQIKFITNFTSNSLTFLATFS
jgi:hypothetical protein